MHLPLLKRENRYRRSIINFGGINRTGDYSPGELMDCSGISHSEFPFITQRKKANVIFDCVNPTAAIFGENECVAADSGLYYNRKLVGELSDGEKQLAVLGKHIVIFPDKVYFDTETGEIKSLTGESHTSGATVSFSANSISTDEPFFKTMTKKETILFPEESFLVTYENAVISKNKIYRSGFGLKKPENIGEKAILYEKCSENQYRTVVMKTYLEKEKAYEFVTELTTLTDITKNVFSELKEGDVVAISGCVNQPDNNKKATILSITGNTIVFSDETFTEGQETADITVMRDIPDFVSVCSYGNRLWGVAGNTIYASALGDATAYYTYRGISTDSFAVESNSAGDFTACISYGNSCYFFKENTCYKLFGNRPANFQLNETFGHGILKNDRKSLCCTGNQLIYKGNGGIFSFMGGNPVRISDALGKMNMENAVAGSNGKLYYITVDTENDREEFVWDIEKNLWSKSGVKGVLGYESYGDCIYRLKNNGIELVSDETDEETEWSITLCPFDEGYYNTKNYSRLRIMVRLFEGAYIRTEIKSDDEKWKTADITHGDSTRYINIPCSVKSCHKLSLRLSGKGKCIIENITREFSVN